MYLHFIFTGICTCLRTGITVMEFNLHVDCFGVVYRLFHMAGQLFLTVRVDVHIVQKFRGVNVQP